MFPASDGRTGTRGRIRSAVKQSGVDTASPLRTCGGKDVGNRPKESQSQHDAAVKREARALADKGWNVKADVPGYETPDPIGKKGFVPDIVAAKRGHTKIVEVETPDSLQADAEQRATFARSAGQKPRTTFETVVPDSPGEKA